MSTTGTAATAVQDEFTVIGVDHVEIYCGNAKQAAQYLTKFGFAIVGRAGLGTGLRDRASWCLRQDGIELRLTSALEPDGPIARHVARHGDAVVDVALAVPDARRAYAHAVERGARGVSEPQETELRDGSVCVAQIASVGCTRHSLVSRTGDCGDLPPLFEPVEHADGAGFGLSTIDHVATCVTLGEAATWARYYASAFAFDLLQDFTDHDVTTEYSALMNKIVGDGGGRIKLSISEPAVGRRRSQITEFMDYHGGAGVQHLALTSTDIVESVSRMHEAGIEFLRVPGEYYEDLAERVPAVADRLDALRELGILVDQDDDGHLLQIFSKPLSDRPTMFLEVIERDGASGFGAGNFKALFEALEREQARRGNL